MKGSPTCCPLKVHENKPLQHVMMEPLTKKKDDDGTDGYGNISKKSSVFLFTFLKNKIVWAEM